MVLLSSCTGKCVFAGGALKCLPISLSCTSNFFQDILIPLLSRERTFSPLFLPQIPSRADVERRACGSGSSMGRRGATAVPRTVLAATVVPHSDPAVVVGGTWRRWLEESGYDRQTGPARIRPRGPAPT